MANRNSAERYNDLGVIAGSYQHYDEAVRYFQKSLQKEPNNQRVEKNLTVVCTMIRSEHKPLPAACIQQ
jgi:hypothetical protein